MADQELIIVGRIACEHCGLVRRIACEHCGLVRPGVRYTEDPYNRDINDTVVMMYLCKQCLRQRAEDI